MRALATGRSFGAMFRSTAVHHSQHRAHALYAWRDAELLVHLRWGDFRLADSSSRRGAFAAYVAALDAEAAAASDLAHACSPIAEAA